MNEERLFILKMLEEGKINAQEAAALLEALEVGAMDEKEPGPENRESAASVGEERDRPSDESASANQASGHRERARVHEEHERGWGHFSRELANQIRESIQSAMRGVPQITEELRENLNDVREELSQSLKGVREEIKKGPLVDVSGLKHLFSNVFGRGPSHEFEQQVKGVWPQGVQPKIEFLTKNGSISVDGWDEPHYRVIVRKWVYCHDEEEAKQIAARAVHITSDEHGLQVICREADRLGVSIEAKVPRSHVYSLEAVSTNGAVNVEGVEVMSAKATTTNGGVHVKKVAGERLDVSTTNGRIACEEIQVNSVDARTTNGGITWDGSALEAKLQTTNGGIRLSPKLPRRATAADGETDSGSAAQAAGATTAHYTAETTNAGIDVRLPADPGLGVRFESKGRGVDLGGETHRFAITAGSRMVRRTL